MSGTTGRTRMERAFAQAQANRSAAAPLALPYYRAYRPDAHSRLTALLNELHDEGWAVSLGDEAQMARAPGAGWRDIPGGVVLAVATYRLGGVQRLYVYEAALAHTGAAARLARRVRLACERVSDEVLRAEDDPARRRCTMVAVDRGRTLGVTVLQHRPSKAVVSFDITREA